MEIINEGRIVGCSTTCDNCNAEFVFYPTDVTPLQDNPSMVGISCPCCGCRGVISISDFPDTWLDVIQEKINWMMKTKQAFYEMMSEEAPFDDGDYRDY